MALNNSIETNQKDLDNLMEKKDEPNTTTNTTTTPDDTISSPPPLTVDILKNSNWADTKQNVIIENETSAALNWENCDGSWDNSREDKCSLEKVKETPPKHSNWLDDSCEFQDELYVRQCQQIETLSDNIKLLHS